MTFKTTIKIAAVAIAAAFSSTSFAQTTGDTIFSAGWVHIAPNDSSTPLSITSPVAETLPGTGASVEKTDTFGVSLTHFFTPNWAASLDLGAPPTYKLQGTGALAPVGQIGEAKQLAPTVLGKYFFADSHTQFRPFVGLGVTHVTYKDVSLTSNFQNEISSTFSQGGLVAGGTTATLNSSWAAVYNVGASYAINKDWYASFSLSYVGLKTTADLTTSTNVGVPILATTTIKIDPIVTFASIGYRF
jgi:outer membrane protein